MKKYFIVLLLVFITVFLTAQQKHVVGAKETLYGLSKKYKVSIEDLKKSNPQLNQRALQIGDNLIIPDKNTPVSTPVVSHSVPITTESKPAPDNVSEYVYITVQPKETLYGLSKKHKTTVEIIKKLNPAMGEKGLKIGEVLKIPNNLKLAESQPKKETKDQPKTITPNLKDTTIIVKNDYTKESINIVMFLPFHTEITNAHAERDIASQFYSGAKIALDSLSNKGRKINLKLIDSGSENKFKESLSNYDFSTTHLIIGPLFKSDILTVADKIKKTPIVSPFSSSDELDKYENLILYDTKEQILAEKLVNEMLKKYIDEKIYILYGDEHHSTALYFQSLIQNKEKNATIVLTKNADDIKLDQNLVTEEYNKIYTILISEEDSFVSKYLENIVNFDDSKIQPISLFYSSLFDSKKYSEKLLNFGLIYSDTKYVNEFGFNEQKTINFYKKMYCNKTPSKYAVVGFDITYDILSRMDNKGILSSTMMKAEAKQLSNKYSFIKIKKDGAWANQGARIIKLLK